ncbi:hypothetical protein M422DRAFT_70099 [Sphaerobolus stellatus SS14]|uniref:Uncharacterized protein n=1 Tax=Sphaerobolus stellatus (strain SS14) TaxID=990650 RepID=A0A0C9UZV9_SPHS4|nr:hypothetical protein M422DRAFT_70099 [Sphaerobolus stellatus SS14]
MAPIDLPHFISPPSIVTLPTAPMIPPIDADLAAAPAHDLVEQLGNLRRTVIIEKRPPPAKSNVETDFASALRYQARVIGYSDVFRFFSNLNLCFSSSDLLITQNVDGQPAWFAGALANAITTATDPIKNELNAIRQDLVQGFAVVKEEITAVKGELTAVKGESHSGQG